MLVQQKQKALTLIELMIGLAMSGFLLLGLFGVYIAYNKTNKLTLIDARLNASVQTASNLIEYDIVNAGSWGGAGMSTNNPFVYASTGTVYVPAGNDCILILYDANADGSLPAISSAYDDERYGYRLRNSAIQYRPRGAAFDCAAIDSAWTNLTDPNVVSIQALTITPQYYSEDIDGAGSGTSQIRMGWVNVAITAAPTGRLSETKSYARTVRIRNEQYVP